MADSTTFDVPRSAADLVLERRDQQDGTVRIGVAALTPSVGEDYWSYRVRLTDGQAVLGFPKFNTIEIGFARETDRNTNLPYTCGAGEILAHIKHNAGDPAISEVLTYHAIELIQDAAIADRDERPERAAEFGPVTTTVTLHPDIAEYIGDGSAHAEDMPGYASSILDEIAEEDRTPKLDHLAYRTGLATAYRAVMRHRFKVRRSFASGGPMLIDTWTGDSPTYLHHDQADDQAHAANQHNADVFAARIDRDIAEGGL